MQGLNLDNLCERVYADSIARHLFSEHSPLLIMISGGSDSTAMAYVFSNLRDAGKLKNIAALHVNHNLRGEQSDSDEEFVDLLCKNLNIPLYKVSIDINHIARSSGDNIEACARRERYVAAADALQSFCEHLSMPYREGRIISAHSLDDRIENFYMRSIVGTGPGGFRALKYRNGNIIHPLLDYKRSELQDFINDLDNNTVNVTLDDEGKRWRVDATNMHTDRFRAYVRHKMMPVAVSWNESLHDTLRRTMNLIGDEDDFMTDLANSLIESCVEFDIDAPSFKLLPEFCKAHKCIQKRAIFSLLSEFLGKDSRVESLAVDRVLEAIKDGCPVSGYTANIQGNLAVSSNKSGILVEPMEVYKRRRKK